MACVPKILPNLIYVNFILMSWHMRKWCSHGNYWHQEAIQLNGVDWWPLFTLPFRLGHVLGRPSRSSNYLIVSHAPYSNFLHLDKSAAESYNIYLESSIPLSQRVCGGFPAGIYQTRICQAQLHKALATSRLLPSCEWFLSNSISSRNITIEVHLTTHHICSTPNTAIENSRTESQILSL